jgi:hypothetical protein
MEPVSFCPECGHVLADGGERCPNCGKLISDPPLFEKLGFEELVEGSFIRLEEVALRGYARRLEGISRRLELLDRELEQIIEFSAPACRQ